MEITVNDVAQARDIVSDLLTELNVKASFFDIEPVDAQWELHIECESNNDWKMIRLPLAKKNLLDCASDLTARTNMLNKLRTALSSCSHS